MEKFRQQGQQNNQEEDERQKERKKGRFIVFLFLSAVIIVSGILLEKFINYFAISAGIIWSLYLAAGGVLITALGAFAWDIYKEDSYLSAPREETDDLFGDIVKKCRRFLWQVSRYGLMIFVLFLLVWLTGTVVWAQGHVASRCRHALIAFTHNASEFGNSGENMGNFDNIEEPGKEGGEASELQEENSSSESEQSQEQSTEPENTSSSEQSSESASPSEPKQLPDPVQSPELETSEQDFDIDAQEKEMEERASKMKIEEPTVGWSISEEERRQVLFEEGEFQISTDWSPEQAKQKVNAFIDNLGEEKLVNVFDTFASQSLQDDIAKASRKDESLVTSTEKDEVITTRLDAYDLYRKNSLAKLLAEDFHFYALAYKHYNGEREIIINYYMLSLKWLYERLKYSDLSERERKQILISIQYRYNDIMTYSEPGTEQWYRAKLLSDTYKLILKDYETEKE
ncbi:MAG: hypothetical protein HFH25_03415 [Lachnospiraceae bacterium]|nr:hypothetical protein [Lachnospiraceae bacterium]